MMPDKTDLLSLSKNELEEIITNKLGLEPYRAGQIYSWMYKVCAFEQMSNISKRHRELLENYFYIETLTIAKKSISKDGTIKYLFELGDGNKIESVFMRYKHGNTVCISVQIGCRMGCVFCASAEGGLVRNLTPAEMLLQIINIERDTDERVSNIVLMGIGEPLDNFLNVIKFLELANSGLGIGMRHISVSTCGLTDKINELGKKNLPLTLSVSLNAPNDEIRGRIMPVNNKHRIGELLRVCKNYAEHTHRRISFEYILIDGLNDSEQDARELASRIKDILCHVNLILVNRVYKQGETFLPPSRKKAEKFKQTLINCGINATFRRGCGGDVYASCGQLRKNNTD